MKFENTPPTLEGAEHSGHGTTAKNLKVLILEDQDSCIESLLESLKRTLGDRIVDFRDGGDIRVITTLEEARKLLQEPEFPYQMAFLDHRFIDFGPITEKDTFHYFDSDMNWTEPKQAAFTLRIDDLRKPYTARNEGYGLLGRLKDKGALVIGTSSMSEDELRHDGFKRPEIIVDNKSLDSDPEIKKKILAALEEKMRELRKR